MADIDEVLTVNINDNLKEVLGQIEYFAADQLPYAQAAALFGVGLDARQEMASELFKRFTIRTGKRPWAARAMYVSPESASKIKRQIIDNSDASITVASRSPLGALLSDGGTRQRKDSGDFAIPILGGARANKTTVIRRGRNAPEDIQRKMKGFFLPSKDGQSKILYVRKKERSKKGKGKSRLQAMFIMKKNVTIKPWWNLRQILANTMQRKLPDRFLEAMQRAMETRR